MSENFVLSLDENSVRFTPSGEIAVMDAIRALSESDGAEEIWQRLKNENPQILSHCRQFHFSKNKSDMVSGVGTNRNVAVRLYPGSKPAAPIGNQAIIICCLYAVRP
jgi:hypothetical protein